MWPLSIFLSVTVISLVLLRLGTLRALDRQAERLNATEIKAIGERLDAFHNRITKLENRGR